MFWWVDQITFHTVLYVVLWAFMMVIGGLMYEQPHFVRKRQTKYKTLELVGWFIIIMAMLGCLHGILALIHWIIV